MSTPQQRGRDYEEEVAKSLGGEPTKGSGNVWHTKLDFQNVSLVISCKYTEAESLRLTQDSLDEVIQAVDGPGGRGGDVVPGLATRVGGPDGTDFITLRAVDLIRLLREDAKAIPTTRAGDIRRQQSHIPVLFRSTEGS